MKIVKKNDGVMECKKQGGLRSIGNIPFSPNTVSSDKVNNQKKFSRMYQLPT